MSEAKSMKSIKSLLIILGSVSLIFLGACSNSNQAANPGSSPAADSGNSSAASPDQTTERTEPASENASESIGGQVVESGAYHLELVPKKEANGTHIDLYLQKGDNHEAISNAKVTAQVQLPDGTQKTLPLTYDAGEKHYAAELTGNVAGQYQVKITSNINGEKVDGRFSFSR